LKKIDEQIDLFASDSIRINKYKELVLNNLEETQFEI